MLADGDVRCDRHGYTIAGSSVLGVPAGGLTRLIATSSAPRMRPDSTPTGATMRSVSAAFTGGLPAILVNSGPRGHPIAKNNNNAVDSTGCPTSMPIAAIAMPGFHGQTTAATPA